ncbi:hypothetical protein GCM10027423_55740 [Spirosoma arcticum]
MALALFVSALTTTFAQSLSTSLSFPQFNSSYLSGTPINLQATATTPAGTTITKVEFYFATDFFSSGLTNPTNGTKIGESLTAPYSIIWTAPTVTAARNYQVRAVVTNSAGNTAIQSGTGYASISIYPTNYVSTRNWYVSATASSTNTAGTEALPLNTIQKAADRVAPGDTVFVMAGRYTSTSITVVGIQRTGTPTRSIVFMPYRTDKPVVALGNTNFEGFRLLPAAAYIQIQGFEVIGNNANVTLAQAQQQPGACEGPNPTATGTARFNSNGISLIGSRGGNLRPHHVVIANNTVHDCGGGGIGGGECDYVTIENNTVYNNSYYTIYGTSGINIINAWNYDNNTTTPRIIIRNNRSFGNILKIAWNIGGTGTNCRFFDGNGIILDNNKAVDPSRPSVVKNPLGDYTGKFLIENNLCYQNGGRGINVNYSDNAIIINNTTYQNGVSDGGPGIGIESEFIAQGANNIRVYSNIFYGRPGEKVTEVNSSTIAYNNNLTFEGTGTPFFSGNQNITGRDPLFVNAAGSDFQLLANSPALNAGSSAPDQYSTKDILGVERPQGAGVDIGAFERQADPPAPGPFAITGVTTASCSTVSTGLRSVSFTPQYAGLSGQPVSFSVVNELAPTTNPGPYTLSLYTDNPVVTLRAVQQGTAGEVSFSYNWLTACNSNGNNTSFAITAVTTVSCQTMSAGLRSVSFTPQYTGVSGQPVSFSVVNELSPTINPGPYTLNLYTDNPLVTLRAVQTGTPNEVTFSYNWLSACSNGSGRLGAEEPRNQLAVKLLGNPVREQVVAEITGANGQSLQLQLTDSKGRLIESRSVEQGSIVERHIFDLRRQASGLVLLRVSTNRQTAAVKVLKQ